MMDHQDECMVKNEVFVNENIDSVSAAIMDIDDSSSENGNIL